MNIFIKKALMIFLFVYVIFFFIPVNKFIEVEEIPLNITKIKQIIDFNSDKTVFLTEGNICIMDNITNKSEVLFEGNISRVYSYRYIPKTDDYFFLCSEPLNKKSNVIFIKNNSVIMEISQVINKHKFPDKPKITNMLFNVDEEGKNILFVYYGKVFLNWEIITFFNEVVSADFIKGDKKINIQLNEFIQNIPDEIIEKFDITFFNSKQNYVEKFVLNKVNPNNNAVFKHKIIAYISDYLPVRLFFAFFFRMPTPTFDFFKTRVFFNNKALKEYGFVYRKKIAYDTKKGNILAYIVKKRFNSSYKLNLVINNRISKDSYNFLSKIVYNEKLDSFLSIVEKSDGNIYMLRAK